MVQEYWNIPGGWITIFYVLTLITILIFFVGFWNKVKIWSKGVDADEELEGKGPVGLVLLSFGKFFTSDSLLVKRVFHRSALRGVMIVGVILSFTVLFLGTVGRSINYWILSFLSGIIWLIFSLVLDVAGALLLIGIVFYIWRKIAAKPEKRFVKTQDWVLLVVLFLIVFSGFCVEGLRLAVTNPPSADWSPIGWVFGTILKGIFGTKVLPALHKGVWLVHFLLAFWFIVMIPFSKYTHIFAAQITTYMFENKWRQKEFPRQWVFGQEIAQQKQKRLKAARPA